MSSGPRTLLLASCTAGLLTVAASAQTPCGPLHYGQATAGTAGLSPVVASSGGAATIGNASFAIEADGAIGGSLLAQLLGYATDSTPLLGVDVLVATPLITPTFATASGQATFPLPIPNTASLAGVHVFTQILSVDPGGPAGIASSDGMQVRVCTNNLLCATSAYQGAAASDAFSSIHALGGGRIIAGKRSSSAANRFLLSDDHGQSWQQIGCAGSTGAHTYFFGQNGDTVLCGTGDTGSACLMRSDDRGLTWAVTATSAQLRALAGSANVRAVFGAVHLGNGNWFVNLKCLDTTTKVLASGDNGLTWAALANQPGQGPAAWSRRMIATSNGTLLWPSVLTDQLYVSTDAGSTWSARTVPGASLFQPLCDAGNGVYFCGDASASPNATLGLHRSLDHGMTWSTVATVNLQRTTPTYWRDVIAVGGSIFASACCHEGTSHERFMQLFRSTDGGATWCSYGNPYQGPYGGMQAIYQMCRVGHDVVYAACQPDSTILRWPVEVIQ